MVQAAVMRITTGKTRIKRGRPVSNNPVRDAIGLDWGTGVGLLRNGGIPDMI